MILPKEIKLTKKKKKKLNEMGHVTHVPLSQEDMRQDFMSLKEIHMI